MTKLNGVIYCFMLLSMTVVIDNAYAKKPQKSAEVSAIYLDVLKIRACAAGQGCSTVGGPKQINLFDLAEGKTDFAKQVLLPAKTHELRLLLGKNSTIAVDGQTYPLTVPSGQDSRLKLKGQKVFGKTGGFLADITLDFDLAKELVVTAKKVKGKGKNAPDTMVYSYALKPVIEVASAEIEPLPENMAGVFVMPDESSKLKMGNDFLLTIPVGAVSEPTLISTAPRSFSIEITDPSTGKTSILPSLSPIYNLSPSGLTFEKPIDVMVHYDKTAIPKGFTENNLVIYHDGDSITSSVDKEKNIVTAQISHFSEISIDIYFKDKCTVQPTIVGSNGKAIDGLTHILCPDLKVAGLHDYSLPNFHLVQGDRKKLAQKYHLEVVSKDAATGGQKAQPVSMLAEKNNAVIAINGNHFDCLTEESFNYYSPFDKGCYKGGTGRSSQIHIEDGKVKGKNNDKNVVFAFGGSSDLLIPIKRLRTSEVTDENNNDKVFEDVFKDEFPVVWQDAVTNGTTEIKVANGMLMSAIGETTTLLCTNTTKIKNKLITETICKPAPNGEYVKLKKEEPYPAFGYGKSQIVFLASNENETVSDWDHYYQLCLVLRTTQAENAILLDGSGSTQLTVRRPAKTGVGTEIVTANNDDDTEDLRHVVNAIALVPKPQLIATSSVSPLQAVLNKPTTFTVNGQNLPLTLVLEIDGCDNMLALGGTPTLSAVAATSMSFYSESNTFSSRTFTCTPSSAGSKTCSVRDTQGGNLLYESNVDFAEDAVTPEVNSVSSNSATLNEPITFTVTGQNLPSTLAFWISECENVTSLGGSSTSMRFSCTPTSYTTGEKNGVIKDAAGGSILKEFTIHVSGSGSPPEESFTCTSGSQTVTWQGRVWQRCDDGKTYTWQEAKNYCDNLALGGYSDWRLPAKDELKSLVVCTNGTPTPLADSPATPYSCSSDNNAPYATPTIDSSFECRSDYYWTSSPKEGTSYMWDVYFYYGHAAWDNPATSRIYVRCVR